MLHRTFFSSNDGSNNWEFFFWKSFENSSNSFSKINWKRFFSENFTRISTQLSSRNNSGVSLRISRRFVQECLLRFHPESSIFQNIFRKFTKDHSENLSLIIPRSSTYIYVITPVRILKKFIQEFLLGFSREKFQKFL